MPTPEQIQQAIRNVTDQRSFIDGLLRDTLDWPIHLDFESIEDITYEWTDDELNTVGLSRDVLAGPVLQMQSLEQDNEQPWGIFILEFANIAPLVTGRGLTGPLRKVLRGLISNRRNRPSNLPIWDRENLLFICTHNYQHFRFAYFKPAKEKGQAEPLAMFGWDSGDAALRTLCEYNLPFLVWSDNPQQPQWREAFNVEKVTKGFYSQVARLFTDLVGGSRKQGSKTYQGKNLLILPGCQNDTIRKEFAVRLIGRLVFCWFLKKKKSKDGVPLLPQELLSTESINNKGIGGYYHSILEPLFFEVLNTPQDERNKQFKKAPWSIIPFLNGGLFTPHEDDFYKLTFNGISEHLNDLIIPDSWIRELFEVFETYNFTIEESTPLDIEVAVDPEILGRIFENLLAEINPETGEATRKKATGSYYTPRPIVEYMVDESLKQYLLTKTKVPEDKLAVLLSYTDDELELSEAEKESVLDALDAIKIIDPACGSGAFPMGILQKILLMLQKIDPDSQKWLSRIVAKIENAAVRKELESKLKNAGLNYIHKLGVIQSSIYGVDIQPIAVDISKLRCFLSLIVDESIDDAKKNRGIEPLPNLEFKFVCANTLIGLPEKEITAGSKKDTKGQSLMFEASDQIKELKELREKYLRSYGKEKKQIEEHFRKTQGKMFEHALNWGGKESQTLKLSQWNPFSDEPCHWFDHEWMFGIGDGFDIVIANPPYLRERDNKERFSEVNNSEYGKKYHQGKMDFWYYFLHKAMDIVRRNGVICYITSRYWLNSTGAKKLIARVKDKLSFVNFVDIGKLKVFNDVAGHHMVAVYTKNKANDGFVYKKLVNDLTDIDKNQNTGDLIVKTLKNSTVISDSCEIIIEDDLIEFNSTIPLGAICDTSIGIQESVDKISRKQFENSKRKDIEIGQGVFVLTRKELNQLYLNREEKRAIKKYLDPNDVFSYGINFDDNKYLIYSDKDIKRQIAKNQAFVRLKKHLDNLSEFITSSNAPYGLHRPREERFFEKPKIIFKNMFVDNEFAYDEDKYYVGFSFSLIIQKNKNYDLKYILAILNSKLALDWFYRYGKKRGAGVDIGVNKLRNFPIRELSQEAQKPLISLVDRILSLTKSKGYLESPAKQVRVKGLEKQIDQMVYKLYDLTPEEIAVIEKSF